MAKGNSHLKFHKVTMLKRTFVKMERKRDWCMNRLFDCNIFLERVNHNSLSYKLIKRKLVNVSIQEIRVTVL